MPLEREVEEWGGVSGVEDGNLRGRGTDCIGAIDGEEAGTEVGVGRAARKIETQNSREVPPDTRWYLVVLLGVRT